MEQVLIILKFKIYRKPLKNSSFVCVSEFVSAPVIIHNLITALASCCSPSMSRFTIDHKHGYLSAKVTE